MNVYVNSNKSLVSLVLLLLLLDRLWDNPDNNYESIVVV